MMIHVKKKGKDKILERGLCADVHETRSRFFGILKRLDANNYDKARLFGRDHLGEASNGAPIAGAAYRAYWRRLYRYDGAARVTQLHRPCFAQMARTCSSVANSPRSASASDSSNVASSSAAN